MAASSTMSAASSAAFPMTGIFKVRRSKTVQVVGPRDAAIPVTGSLPMPPPTNLAVLDLECLILVWMEGPHRKLPLWRSDLGCCCRPTALTNAS